LAFKNTEKKGTPMKIFLVQPAIGMVLLFLFTNMASAQWAQTNGPGGSSINGNL
jgi:hypothetical protein